MPVGGEFELPARLNQNQLAYCGGVKDKELPQQLSSVSGIHPSKWKQSKKETLMGD